MSCREIETLLDGFVDGESTPAERERVERHLAECAACRRAEEETRALVEQASRLPRELAPGRDLFAGVRERIDRQGARAERRLPSPAVLRPGWWSVAAAVVVVALAGVTTLWLRNGSSPDAPSSEPAEAMVAARPGEPGVDLAIRDYQSAAELLLGAIRERQDRLSPQTLEVLEKNLAIIDRAIDEVRATLDADPSNPENALVLTAMHEQKVEFLRRVSRLAS